MSSSIFECSICYNVYNDCNLFIQQFQRSTNPCPYLVVTCFVRNVCSSALLTCPLRAQKKIPKKTLIFQLLMKLSSTKLCAPKTKNLINCILHNYLAVLLFQPTYQHLTSPLHTLISLITPVHSPTGSPILKKCTLMYTLTSTIIKQGPEALLEIRTLSPNLQLASDIQTKKLSTCARVTRRSCVQSV